MVDDIFYFVVGTLFVGYFYWARFLWLAEGEFVGVVGGVRLDELDVEHGVNLHGRREFKFVGVGMGTG